MLSSEILLTMFQYGHDTCNHLLDFAALVTPEQWDARQEADQRSLHETLFHILAVEDEWLYLCQTKQPPVWGALSIEQYPDVASLRAFNEQIFATYAPFVASLTDAQLTTRLAARYPSDRAEAAMTWHILVHMLYHSAQHRSEAASILTRYGHSPSFIDFYGHGTWYEA